MNPVFSQVKSYLATYNRAECLKSHALEFSISNAVALTLQFIAGGAVWSTAVKLLSVNLFSVPLFLACFGAK